MERFISATCQVLEASKLTEGILGLASMCRVTLPLYSLSCSFNSLRCAYPSADPPAEHIVMSENFILQLDVYTLISFAGRESLQSALNSPHFFKPGCMGGGGVCFAFLLSLLAEV